MFRSRTELARLMLEVHGDLLHVLIEDSHRARVPSNPEPPAQVLRWNRVGGRVYFHVAVAMNGPLGLVEEREVIHRERHERLTFHLLKDLDHLLAGGAVDAGVGH